MNEKRLEEMIESRKVLKLQTNNPVSETYIDMFIRDLQSLQPTTEERKEYIKIDYYCPSCWTHITNKMWCPNEKCRLRIAW